MSIFSSKEVLFLNLLEDKVAHFQESAVTDPSMAGDGASLGEALFARPQVSDSIGLSSTGRHDVTGDNRDTNTAEYAWNPLLDLPPPWFFYEPMRLDI